MVVSVRVLHCKVTFPPSVINKYLVGRYLKTIYDPISQIFTLNFSILCFFLAELLLKCLLNGDFCNYVIPPVFISWHFTLKEHFLLSIFITFLFNSKNKNDLASRSPSNWLLFPFYVSSLFEHFPTFRHSWFWYLVKQSLTSLFLLKKKSWLLLHMKSSN